MNSSVDNTSLTLGTGSSPHYSPSHPMELNNSCFSHAAQSNTTQCVSDSGVLQAVLAIGAHSLTHTSALPGDPCASHVVGMYSPSHALLSPSSHVTDIVPDLCKMSNRPVTSEWEDNATAKVPCLTDHNERKFSLLCDTLSLQQQPLTEEHAVQEEQLGSFPSGVNHVRAVSLPPLSSRSSNSSGSPNSSSLFEEEPVFTFPTKVPGRAASLSPSVTQRFGDPPSVGKPKITMSAAELLQKVRAKRSSQPPLPSLQEQQHEQLSVHPSSFPQKPPLPEDKDASLSSSSRGEGHGIDLNQLMMKFQNHMKTKQKRKKQDKSWRHVSNIGVGSHSLGWYGVYPVPSMVVPLPNHPFLGCKYSIMPETALPLSVANPETALSLSVAHPETSLPLSVANTETDLPLSVTNPETDLPLSVTNPETALPLSVTNPETALPLSVTNPETALPFSSVANPETALPFSSVANPDTVVPLSVANPETALSLSVSNKNNCKEQVGRTNAHNDINIQPSVDILKNTRSVQSSEYSTAAVSIPCYHEPPVPCALNASSLSGHTSQGECAAQAAYSQEEVHSVPSTGNMAMILLSPHSAQQLPSLSGAPLISENPVETTRGISENIHICSSDKQRFTNEGSIQVDEQFSSSIGLPCSANQYVSLHLSSTNQHLPFTHNAGESGNSCGDEKVITETEAVSDDDVDHNRGISLHIPAIFDLTMSYNNGKTTSPSGLCGVGVTADDYEHVDMVTSPVGTNSSDATSLTCNAGVNKGCSDISLAPTHEHNCFSSDDKERIANESVSPVESDRLNKALEVVYEGAGDGGANTYMGCMVAEPTALEVKNCSSTTNTSNIKKHDKQYGSVASFFVEQHRDMSHNGIASEAVASSISERPGGAVSRKISIDKPFKLMLPNQEPPRNHPALDCIVGNFRSREQGRRGDRNTYNLRPHIIDLTEGDSYLNRERSLSHTSGSEKHLPQRERQQPSLVWHSSGQSGQMVEGAWSSSSFQRRGNVTDKPAQYSSNSAGNAVIQPLMNLQLSSDSIPQNIHQNIPQNIHQNIPQNIPQNGSNIATLLRGTSLPANARASIYNRLVTFPHSWAQYQDLNRQGRVMINRYPGHIHSWQEHPTTLPPLQRPEGSSQPLQPLLSASHHPSLVEGRGGWSNSDRARRSSVHHPDSRLQRGSYDSSENFTVNNFGNPSVPYYNQGSRYPRSRLRSHNQ